MIVTEAALSNGTPPVTTIQTSTPSTSKSDGQNVDTKSDAASSKASNAPSSLSHTYSVTTRYSSSLLKSKHSRPPSPPSVYASFGYEGPIKNPRPLLLESGM